jgi:two-component system sensor histidine kinase/response regulator
MSDHLPKPIKASQLLDGIGRWIVQPEAEIPSYSLEDDLAPMISIDGVSELPGINMHIGLTHCLNDSELYRKLLHRFYEREIDFVQRFAKLAGADLREAARSAHTLKGIAAIMGAEALQYAALALEKGCKENRDADEISESLQEVEKLLAPIIKGLAALKQPGKNNGDDVVGGDAEPEKIKSILVKLRGLLENFDASAVQALDELKMLRGLKTHQILLKKLFYAIGEYEFEQALQVLDELRERVADEAAKADRPKSMI